MLAFPIGLGDVCKDNYEHLKRVVKCFLSARACVYCSLLALSQPTIPLPRVAQSTTLSLHSRHLFLYTPFRPFWFARLHSLRQFQQVHHSKQRPTRSHNDECI